MDSLVRRALDGGIPLFLFVVSLLAGGIALQFTPREEEPQIVVPMLDVLVTAPGLSSEQVARQVTIPVEKLLSQIPGVEHVYSSSGSGQAAITLRFHVGEDREESILNTYNKLFSNQDQVPEVVSDWLVRPIEVDDVPIVMVALWSEDRQKYDDFELRRLAEEITTHLQGISRASVVRVVGGRPRTIRVILDPESLAARGTTALEVADALHLSNRLDLAGTWTLNNRAIVLEAGDFVRTIDEFNRLPVNVIDGETVYLEDVARVQDGPAEPGQYTWIEFAPGHPVHHEEAERQVEGAHPSVTISIAKHQGSNAVSVAREVHARLDEIKRDLLPPEIHVEILRDYGQTANEKVNNLSSSLAFAIITVVIFIGVFLGLRPALVVGLAVPICYGITLALDLAFGYTINRVTLFALILSLGLLVDDPITGVDNIERFIRRRADGISDAIVRAMAEIRTPLLMSTLTIVLAFIPLAFITGMMGPYMAPMAFNVPLSVIASTLVAFLVTPWLARRLLKPPKSSRSDPPDSDETPGTGAIPGIYARTLAPLLSHRRRARWVLWGVLALFLVAASLPLFRLVPLKLLPYDNKNEVQIIIDMPEHASLEQTAALARSISQEAARLPEVRAIAAYVGTNSPMDFNGMVRRYYQRTGTNVADLRLTLVDKSEREHQSHAVVLRLREQLKPFNQDEARIKVVEVPPGPPVLSTLVAEIYADTLVSYEAQRQAARQVMERLAREAQVTEVDSTVEHTQQRLRFVTDKSKAALSGVSTQDISETLALANRGQVAGYLQLPREATPLPIELRLSENERSSTSDFLRLSVKGRQGIVELSTPQGLETAARPLVPLGELGQFETMDADRMIHRKDLRPVVYVTAEISGRTPAEVIADVSSDLGSGQGSDSIIGNESPSDWRSRNFLSPGSGDAWSLPDGIRVRWTGEGEWRITVRVFRDMGLAFAFALVGIFFVLRLQTASTALSLIIMSAIPLTIIGIMPGFWLINLFGERNVAGAPDPVMFTATAMIGMIALAGIVVRNSLILVEFISQARAQGLAIKEALLQAGSVRMRPVLLTAGTTMLGNLVIILDPVFSGLALAIIFGIVASTLFTLLVVPVVYLLVFDEPENASQSS